VALICSTTTSKILLNREPGKPIKHGRGLRQGDPLSPMLFILAMDPLQQMLDMTTRQGLLNPIGADPIKFRTSLYADDAMLFVRPIASDDIQATFGQFQVQYGQFPCMYIGLPLRIGRLRHGDEQVLIDKVAGKLPKWKGKLLNKAGRLTLIKSVLTRLVIYHMVVFPLSKWGYKKDRQNQTILLMARQRGSKGWTLLGQLEACAAAEEARMFEGAGLSTI
jgi:hypothetical protein